MSHVKLLIDMVSSHKDDLELWDVDEIKTGTVARITKLAADAYLQKHKIKRLNRESQEEYIARVAAIMMDGKTTRKKRVAAMKNVVPKTKEKADADYAIVIQ
jgi:hypothetical protein